MTAIQFNYPNYVQNDTVLPLKVKMTEVVEGVRVSLTTDNVKALFQLRDHEGDLVETQSVTDGKLLVGDGFFIIGAFTAPAVGSYKYQFQITISGYNMTLLSGTMTVVEDIARYG